MDSGEVVHKDARTFGPMEAESRPLVRAISESGVEMQLTRSFSVALKRCHYVKLVALVALLALMPLASMQASEGTPFPPAAEQQPPALSPDPLPAAPANEAAGDGSVPAGQANAPVPAPPVPADEGSAEPQPADANPAEASSTPASQPPVTAPVIEPAPTVAPATISWSQPEPVRCTAIAGNAQSLALGDTATWRCQAAIQTQVTEDLPDDLHILWSISAAYTGDNVRLALPEGSIASVSVPGSAAGSSSERATYLTNWSDGTSLIFDVNVTRTSCNVQESALVLSADVKVKTADAAVQIVRSGDDSAVTRLVTLAAGNGEPSVRFEGPVTFEARSATTLGLDSRISQGVAVLVVEGAWDPCSTWTLDLLGTVGVPTGVPAALRVVSVNNQPISGDACDLDSGCALVVLPETGDAAAPLRYTVRLELHLDELTPAGDFGIDLQTRTHAVESRP